MAFTDFFKPDFPRLLLIIAGVLIGLTVSFDDLKIKIALFVLAIILIIFSDKVKKKERGE